MCTLSNIRQLVQERDATPQVLRWLKFSPLRSSTSLREALERRLNILKIMRPELPTANTRDEAINLLEEHYLNLEAQLLLQLPVIEQLYYDVVLANWHEITRLLSDNGATTIYRQYNTEGEPSIILCLSCSKEHFLERMEHSWHLSNWSDCKSLFRIQM